MSSGKSSVIAKIAVVSCCALCLGLDVKLRAARVYC